jgi:hypothetical protein
MAMSAIKVGDVVRCVGSCHPYFKAGDVGTVVEVSDGIWYRMDLNGNKIVHGDGLWGAQRHELEHVVPVVPDAPIAHAGHSGKHDGLQQHSVGGCYPYAVVTYGHDPAVHVVENLCTGTVACFRGDNPRQWFEADKAFAFCNRVADGFDGSNTLLGAIEWVPGRPKWDNDKRRLVMPPKVTPSKVKQSLLLFAEVIEQRRIGRPLTPYEVYQLACDVDNR